MRGRTCHRLDVVVMRALPGLGDFLCAVPALRLLRWSLPNSRIRLIGIDTTGPLVARFSRYVDELVAFPGWTGIPERSERPDYEGFRACTGADLLLQMHGDGSVSNSVCQQLRPTALAAVGSVRTITECHVSTRPAGIGESEIARCLDVASRGLALLGLGPALGDTSLEFPLTDTDHAEASSCRRRAGFEGVEYVVLHVGASTDARRWPLERFAEVGRTVAAAGYPVVLTGTKAETGIVSAAAKFIGASAVDVAGMLSLGATASMLAGARFVVANDTGISHLARAVGTPTVVIFTASDPNRWASNGERHRAVVAEARSDAEEHAPPPVSDALAAIAALAGAI